jgi:hypothetical protein
LFRVSTPFRFDRWWSFAATPSELWSVISRTEDFTTWWPWLRDFDLDSLTEGATARCVVQAPIPYRLRFAVHVRRVIPVELIDTVVSGDLAGPARLEVDAHGEGSRARLKWEVDLCDPLLRVASRLARPMMEWGHNWVVESGVHQFRLRALGQKGS